MQQPEPSANFDTHWSRALYYDFFAAQEDDKEMLVATDPSSRDAPPQREGSQDHTAAHRLAIFIAIYTAVAFAVHFLFWPAAAAASAPDAPTTVLVASPSSFSSLADPLAPGESMDPDAGRGDPQRTCMPNAATQSMSLYD